MPFWLVMVVLAEGLIVAAMAQSLAPGRGSPSVPATILLSLVGAYLAGLIAWVFVNSATAVVFAVIGATALVYTRRRFLEGR